MKWTSLSVVLRKWSPTSCRSRSEVVFLESFGMLSWAFERTRTEESVEIAARHAILAFSFVGVAQSHGGK